MYCRKCGTQLAEGANFCPSCGEKVAMPVKETTVPNPTEGIISEAMPRTVDCPYCRGKLYFSNFRPNFPVTCSICKKDFMTPMENNSEAVPKIMDCPFCKTKLNVTKFSPNSMVSCSTCKNTFKIPSPGASPEINASSSKPLSTSIGKKKVGNRTGIFVLVSLLFILYVIGAVYEKCTTSTPSTSNSQTASAPIAQNTTPTPTPAEPTPTPIPANSDENKNGLSEQNRMKIYVEINKADERGGKAALPLFADKERWVDYVEKMTKKFRQEIAKKYRISMKQIDDIYEEGISRHWSQLTSSEEKKWESENKKFFSEVEAEKKKRESDEKKREMEAERKGPEPELDAWDGAALCVKYWLKNKMNDPDSFKIISSSSVFDKGSYWTVRVKYRAKNLFGGYVVESKVVNFRNDKNSPTECTILKVQD